ncbi:disulfide bond formation protein B [Xanthobacter sp. TB0139]|uniref:disulfide bond formation protein B n=1 Tax=Xanthobacter sp. TB0139 TaxID=3459178 RepID=UPI004039C639
MSSNPRSAFSLPAASALILALGSLFALAAAWYFQLVIGLAPCPLCLEQRMAYYAGVPLALLSLVLLVFGTEHHAWVRMGRVLLGVLALAMFANAGLAAYHAGVEWGFWAGPASCAGGVPQMTTDVLAALKGARVPRCDDAPWRLFGVSMAGWNVLIAAGLGGVASCGALWPRKG